MEEIIIITSSNVRKVNNLLECLGCDMTEYRSLELVVDFEAGDLFFDNYGCLFDGVLYRTSALDFNQQLLKSFSDFDEYIAMTKIICDYIYHDAFFDEATLDLGKKLFKFFS